MTDQPPTEQQLDEITTIASRATADPFYVSDCEGSLQVWREKALTHVRRDESGEIDMYSFPSTYKVTDQIIELDLNTWDLGEDATDDQRRQDVNDLVEARAALPALLADLQRARDRVAELEAFAYGCDAEGCVLPHSSWCDAAKKTAAANEGCTCGRPWTGHPQPHAMHCWTVNPPRAEVEEMRKRIAELSATVAPDAASEVTSAPLRPSQPSSVSESAQSPTGAPEGALRAPLPVEDFTGTQPCGHDDYHDPHPWADRPNVWCPGIGYDDDQAAVETDGTPA
jgi:hypothetical protein